MPSSQTHSRRKTNPWLIALTVSLATFMEVMDTSIANVALRHIAGSLGAGESEATWVLTSYLVSNAIILPISGWLSSVIGPEAFLYDVRGAIYGQLVPLRHRAQPRNAAGISGAPGGGRGRSGALRTGDSHGNLSTRTTRLGVRPLWFGRGRRSRDRTGFRRPGSQTPIRGDGFFFINIPVGILSLCLTYLLVQESASSKKETRQATRKGIKIDYIGFGLIALGIGCLQIVLDKGQEDDWFGSNFILIVFQRCPRSA